MSRGNENAVANRSSLVSDVWEMSGEYAEFSLEQLPPGNAWGAVVESEAPASLSDEDGVMEWVRSGRSVRGRTVA